MAALKQNRGKWKYSDDQNEIMYFERICRQNLSNAMKIIKISIYYNSFILFSKISFSILLFRKAS